MGPALTADDVTTLFVQDFIKAQNKVGLDPHFLATSLKRLIRAKKTDTFKGEVTTYDESGKPSKTEDVVIYSKPMEDNATRRLALQMALNIRGIQTTSPTTQVNIDKPGNVNLMGYVAQVLSDTDGSEIIEP